MSCPFLEGHQVLTLSGPRGSKSQLIKSFLGSFGKNETVRNVLIKIKFMDFLI